MNHSKVTHSQSIEALQYISVLIDYFHNVPVILYNDFQLEYNLDYQVATAATYMQATLYVNNSSCLFADGS